MTYELLQLKGRYSVMDKFGATPDIDATDTNEEVWDGTGAYPFPAAATVMKVSSSSTNDTATGPGTGALTVTINGLDANYANISETVTMNGQTAVNTTNSYLRVFRAYVATAGTGTTNAGDVWVGTGDVTSGVPATKYAGILTGMGQTLMAIYTIPAGHTAKVIRWYGTLGGATSTFATMALQKREFGGAWRTQRLASWALGQWFSEELPFGLSLSAKCDLRLRCVVNGANNTRIQGGFDVIVE